MRRGRATSIQSESMGGALDCRWCGACCCNPPENQREGHARYVLVEPGDVISAHPALMRRYTVEDAGFSYLRITPAQRCVALEGRVGKRNQCMIYDVRPAGCREVEAGSDECLHRRRQAGL